MAKQDDDRGDEEDLDSTEGEGSSRGRIPGKVLILKFVLPVLLIVGAGAGAFLSGALDGVLGTGQGAVDGGEAGASEEPEEPKEVVYYDLPDMLVNLSGPGRKTHYLKISVSLEVTNADDVSRLQAVLPRIIDNFQVYLRELRVEDLQGSAGIYRLREELLTRVTLAAAPAKVNDVLFKEMLIQ